MRESRKHRIIAIVVSGLTVATTYAVLQSDSVQQWLAKREASLEESRNAIRAKAEQERSLADESRVKYMSAARERVAKNELARRAQWAKADDLERRFLEFTDTNHDHYLAPGEITRALHECGNTDTHLEGYDSGVVKLDISWYYAANPVVEGVRKTVKGDGFEIMYEPSRAFVESCKAMEKR